MSRIINFYVTSCNGNMEDKILLGLWHDNFTVTEWDDRSFLRFSSGINILCSTRCSHSAKLEWNSWGGGSKLILSYAVYTTNHTMNNITANRVGFKFARSYQVYSIQPRITLFSQNMASHLKYPNVNVYAFISPNAYITEIEPYELQIALTLWYNNGSYRDIIFGNTIESISQFTNVKYLIDNVDGFNITSLTPFYYSYHITTIYN
ncbi:MAG: hypothetical protein EBQ92_02000 [Proteobacteria bacterium]|nr:hypothetical protein [Pseudomonadota bacterium]